MAFAAECKGVPLIAKLLDVSCFLVTGHCGRKCGWYRGYNYLPEEGCAVHSPDSLIQRFMNWVVVHE